MILYHASKQIVEYPEIRKTKYTKDFSWGFYCTNLLDQAVRWANRGVGTPFVNVNDTIWNYVNDFLTGRINRKQFWVLAEFKHPTHQISFHSLAALDCLSFKEVREIYV